MISALDSFSFLANFDFYVGFLGCMEYVIVGEHASASLDAIVIALAF